MDVMTKFIAGVEYRHPLLTAYLRIVGRTRLEGEEMARRVGAYLKKALPSTAEVRAARYRGVDKQDHESFEIPIIIADCESAARATLAKLVLGGTV